MLELHSPQQAAQWLHSQVTGTLHTDSRKLHLSVTVAALESKLTSGFVGTARRPMSRASSW